MRISKTVAVIVSAMIILVCSILFLTLGYSLGVAVIVSAILIMVCSYMFLAILIRGRHDTSGYTIDWETSPVGMCIALLSFLSCPVLVIWGWSISMRAHNLTDCVEPYHIYMTFQPGLRPDFCYEGSGVQRELFVTQDDDGTFHFSYSAMSLPSGVAWVLNGANDIPEYRIFEISGILSCSDGHCVMEGDLQSRGCGQLEVIGADDKVGLYPGINHIKMVWYSSPTVILPNGKHSVK